MDLWRPTETKDWIALRTGVTRKRPNTKKRQGGCEGRGTSDCEIVQVAGKVVRFLCFDMQEGEVREHSTPPKVTSPSCCRHHVGRPACLKPAGVRRSAALGAGARLAQTTRSLLPRLYRPAVGQ